MKKVAVVFLMLVVVIGFTSCEPESTVDIDNVYATGKDETPSVGDKGR